MSTEGSTTSESGSTEDLYPADQPIIHINNNLDDAEPQPNNMILQNIVSKLNNNKGGKKKTKKRRVKKTRTSKRKSRKMRKSKKQK